MRVDLDPRRQIAEHLSAPIYYGKPELGWEGDPDLQLTFHAITNRWELLRHEPRRGDPDRHVIECQGPVGQDINEEAINLMIMGLVARSTNRRGNSAEEQMERVFEANDRAERARLQEATETTGDALAKFYTEAGKTLGVAPTYY
jgi:hypothetical protein